jgi:hypothetical protein
MSVIQISREDLPKNGATLYTRLVAGDILHIKNVKETFWVRDILIDRLRAREGDSTATELEKWCNHAVVPSPKTALQVAELLQEAKRKFIFPTIFSDVFKELNFPRPTSAECGAPRVNLPLEIEREAVKLAEKLNPGLLHPVTDDPTFHHIFKNTPYPHRDVGRPQISFQANAWCALQDLDAEESALIFFPEAFRDIERDRTYYAFDKELPPEEWGFGKPLRIKMQLGDMLLFSGDHFHSSPVSKQGSLRLSVEMRVVGNCFDDRGWYRLGFLNLNNFMPSEGPGLRPNALVRAQNAWGTESKTGYKEAPLSAITCLNKIVTSSADHREIAEQVELMRGFQFSEDRYLWPHFYFQRQNPESTVAGEIQDHVIHTSENFYWLLIFGGFALAAGRINAAEIAFERARLFGSREIVDTSSNAVDFFDALSQGKSWLLPMLYSITPEDIDEVIRLYKQGYVNKGCHADSIELVPGFPFIKGMYKLYYPYLQYYPKNDEDIGRSFLTLPKRIIRRFERVVKPKSAMKFPARRLEVGDSWLSF